MYKFRFRHHTPARKSGKSPRQGGKQHYPRRMRPLTLARTESRYRPRRYALLRQNRTSTFKGRRYTPIIQARAMIRKNRLPLLGLRSQQAFNLSGVESLISNLQIDLRETKDRLHRKIPAKHNVCSIRSERRSALFAIRKAGNGFRKSPGKGGSYRRTPDSETTCRKTR